MGIGWEMFLDNPMFGVGRAISLAIGEYMEEGHAN